jgi:hypothetical protein
MDVKDPLPQLLRLRGAVELCIEDPSTINAFSMDALADSYRRLRARVRGVAVGLGVEEEEFDAIFPVQAEAAARNQIAIAKAAAALLRQLDGYLDGLIETAAINQQVSVEQLQAAREAARRPVGFS